MRRLANWMPYEVKRQDEPPLYHVRYAVLCAACGRTLAWGSVLYRDDQLHIGCSLEPNWHRNAVGTFRRAKRMPRRKFEYTLPDDSKMHANLCIALDNDGGPERGCESFEIECDGKLLLDGRYVPCKERNLVVLPSRDNDMYQRMMP